MTPEQHDAFLDSADAFGTARDHWAEVLDALTERGFSISLASIRDHTNCQTCGGSGKWQNPSGLPACSENGILGWVDCPGGSPVVWSAEP